MPVYVYLQPSVTSGLFWFQSPLQEIKWMFIKVQVRWLTWPIRFITNLGPGEKKKKKNKSIFALSVCVHSDMKVRTHLVSTCILWVHNMFLLTSDYRHTNIHGTTKPLPWQICSCHRWCGMIFALHFYLFDSILFDPCSTCIYILPAKSLCLQTLQAFNITFQ